MRIIVRGCRGVAGGGQRGRGEAGGPGLVDEGDVEHVAEVSAVFVAEGGEFHLDKGVEGEDAEGDGFFGVGDVGGGGGVVGADFFAGHDDVDGVAGFGVGAVEEHFHAGDVALDEAGGLEGAGGGGEVWPAEEDVDILGVADGGGVDGGDPGGDGVAPGDGVGDAGGFECGGGTGESVANAFHGEHHPVEERHVGGQWQHANSIAVWWEF